MKTLAIATLTVAALALSMPANAHMRCGWQWPNDDVHANSVAPRFAPNDCMADQLNQMQLQNGIQVIR